MKDISKKTLFMSLNTQLLFHTYGHVSYRTKLKYNYDLSLLPTTIITVKNNE
jgi:hypothetical protein